MVGSLITELPAGTVVTISRTIVDYVVTEHGIARLRGKTLKSRVAEMISIAHPDFRGELIKEAKKLMVEFENHDEVDKIRGRT